MRGNLEHRKALMGRFAFSVRWVGPIRDVDDKVHLSICVCFLSELLSTDILKAEDSFFKDLSTATVSSNFFQNRAHIHILYLIKGVSSQYVILKT